MNSVCILKLCHSCELWERIYRKYSETPITPELEMLAQEKGWRRLFFTNKLQLQVHVIQSQGNLYSSVK